MSSGVEIAGLVLGTLPLIDQSIAAVTFIKLYGSYRRDIELIALEVRTQAIVLRNTLEVLFYGAIPREEVEELLSNPTNANWQQPHIDAVLKERLGQDAYNVFVQALQRLLVTMTSLEKSLHLITHNSNNSSALSRQALRWAFTKDKTRQQLEVLKSSNHTLELIAGLKAEESRQSQSVQAIRNINGILETVGDVQRVAHNLESFTAGEASISAEIESMSIYSVETEAGSDDPEMTLSYLSLFLEPASGEAAGLTQDALLDTGATACAISVTLAQDLRLDIEEDGGGQEVRTAALNQTLRTVGRSRLIMRWKDSKGKKCGTKIWVYVVYGLAQPVILSHDFTLNHPEVWSVARRVVKRMEELQVLWFSHTNVKEQKRQQELRAKRLEENKAKAKARNSAQEGIAPSTDASVADAASTSDSALSVTTHSGSQSTNS